MLRTPAPFPHVGAAAFLAPDATPVRILRRHADGTALVQVVEQYPTASSTRTVDAADLHEQARTADTGLRPRRRTRKAA